MRQSVTRPDAAGPQEVAHDIAAARIRQLQTERPDLIGAILLDGASPGGNINTIDAPLLQVQALASLIDLARDGFWRDNALIDAALARHLYERGHA